MIQSTVSPVKVRVPGEPLITNVIGILVIIPIIEMICIFGLSKISAGLGVSLAIIFGITAYLFPVIIADDISERIPEIKAIKSTNENLKKTKVRHPNFYVILGVTVLFGWTFIGYIIAFIMAHMPCDADIPPNLAVALGYSESDIESKLKEIDSLLAKGLINVDEAKTRREKIISKV